MSAVQIGSGLYSYRKYKDKKGTYYMIVDPTGRDLVPLDTVEYAKILLPHLNRSNPKQATLSEGLHVVTPEAPGSALSPFPVIDT